MKREFNLSILGHSGVGKTTFIQRFLTGDFELKHNITVGPKYHCKTFNTSIGKMIFNICDGTKDDNVDCAIIMVDERIESTNIDHYIESVKQLPIVFVVNKSDKDLNKSINVMRGKYGPLFTCSVRNNANLDDPFIRLLEMLCDEEFDILENDMIEPPILSKKFEKLTI
jgi:GTP-binding nuclear protein Ran